jgi:hypothetical protein
MFSGMLYESFRNGGWPMFPILVLGILQIVAAGRYSIQPDARQLLVARSLGQVTVTFGVLGSVLGMIHCLTAMDQVPVELIGKFALLGLGESINNFALALLLTVFSGLVTTVGALRAAGPPPAGPR